MFIRELLQRGGHRQICPEPIHDEPDVTVVRFGRCEWVGKEIGEENVL
jgi:hypothetical protein